LNISGFPADRDVGLPADAKRGAVSGCSRRRDSQKLFFVSLRELGKRRVVVPSFPS
jgi:hypothetical protein